MAQILTKDNRARERTMAMYPKDASGMESAVANAIHEHWKLFLVEGIILVILGMAAIIVPPVATFAFAIVIGVLSLTFVLIAFFVIEGIVTIMYAIDHRTQLSGRWGWMLASGVVDLILAGIIFAGLPGTAAWALGLLVGINMVFGGTAMIGMALAAKEPA